MSQYIITIPSSQEHQYRYRSRIVGTMKERELIYLYLLFSDFPPFLLSEQTLVTSPIYGNCGVGDAELPHFIFRIR